MPSDLALTFILTTCSWLHLCEARSQWIAAGLPEETMNVRDVHATPSGDTIYYVGAIPTSLPGWQSSNAVMRYSATGWDTLGVLNDLVNSVVHYRDTLIAGGSFFRCSGTPCEGVAYYDGDVWRPYGNLERGVRKLRVLDGDLYAVGGFQTADGHPAAGVAKRVGNAWVPVGDLDLQSSILDITVYDDKLVVIGGLVVDGGHGIAQWDGAEWHLVGPGILNQMSGAQCLTVFQNDLYVAGAIALAPPGNPGQNIMRWDGSQFHALGQGIQWELGNTTSIATVLAMTEQDGVLFVGGGYRAAGGIEALGLSTWDGSEWCGVPGDFRASGGVLGMDFYRDTLFAACGVSLDGEIVNRGVKFIGEDYTTTCSGPVSILAHSTQATPRVHPNPTTGPITVNFDRPVKAASHYTLFDAMGRMLHQGPLAIGAMQEQLDLSHLVKGSYILRFSSPIGVEHMRVVLE